MRADTDHSMLGRPETEQQYYAERTGIQSRLERYCRHNLSERALFVSQHRRAGGIAHLHPAPSPPGAIRKIPALGHNPFETEFTNVPENDYAVALEMLGIPNAVALDQEPLKLLLALLEGLFTPVLPI